MIHHRKHKKTKNTQNRRSSLFCALCTFVFFVVNPPAAPLPMQAEKVTGRWDITVTGSDGSYPSWLEISKSGDHLTGRFVGRWGAVQPVKSIRFHAGQLEFAIDREGGWPHDLIFKGNLSADRLSGTTHWSGEEQSWTASRAPTLARTGVPNRGNVGNPIRLLNGTDLAGWKPYPASKPNNWKFEAGMLINEASGANLVTEQRFDDFQLHFEFKIAAGSDSGVYLRGRYEIEIEDSFGKPPDSHRLGGIYGFLTPVSNPARRADEWQTVDATLVGRRVTINLNGVKIIDNEEIPGITGAALESDEGSPGPLMLQGDYGKVWYRNIVLTPAK
jgi:Domain of Unknown Function (DUF1080)